MDEHDRNDAIRRRVREWAESIRFRNDVQLNPDAAVRELDDRLPQLSRRRKGSLRQQLDRDQLSRRDFLKLLGLTGIGVAAAIGFDRYLRQELGARTSPTGHQTACDYRTIDASEQSEKSIGSGDTFENVIIDQTADGAAFELNATGNDWVIRNVGFRGTADWSGHGGFQISARTSSGGSGLIENVYMNQISDGPTDSEMGGIFARRRHAGHIDIRHTYIQGYGNNAAYCAGPGKTSHGVPGGEGTVAFENCYHRDNTVSQFRIGTPGSTVRNCVGVVNDTDNRRGGYPNNGSRNTRCAWGRHFPDLTVENCSFYVHPDEPSFHATFMATHIDKSKGDECILTIRDCDVNNDNPETVLCSKPKAPCDEVANADVRFENLNHSPSLEVIGGGGVPTDPEMAAHCDRGTPPAPDAVTGEPTAANTAPGTGTDADTQSDPC